MFAYQQVFHLISHFNYSYPFSHVAWEILLSYSLSLFVVVVVVVVNHRHEYLIIFSSFMLMILHASHTKWNE